MCRRFNSWRSAALSRTVSPFVLNGPPINTIPPPFVQHSQTQARRLGSPMSHRRINSVHHFTPSELRLYGEYMDRKARMPPSPIPQEQIDPLFYLPRIYNQDSSTWAAADHKPQGLERRSVLKVASWNLDWNSPGPAARTSAALAHLRHIFGEAQDHLVIMLQEVCQESLQVILEHAWVQRNFILSNVEPPKSLCIDILGRSFVFKETRWRATPYFTLMMVSRTLPTSNCFRIPFTTGMGRDALVVDIPVLNAEGMNFKESFRLCTTHLESLWGGKAYRLCQLASISALLKGALTPANNIIGGVVGGDMNAIDRSEHDYHRAAEVDLKDVWEDEPAPPPPVLKPFKRDTSYGRARGNTWGYQSARHRDRKRMDKFFYTGSIKTFAVDDAQDVVGRLGRLGMGLKTEVEGWELETEGLYPIVKGRLVNKPYKEYISEERALRLRDRGLSSGQRLTRTKMEGWVSDHFGIVVGIRIL